MNSPHQQKSIPELAHKWVKGTATSEEKKDFDQWYTSFQDEELELEDSAISDKDDLGSAIYARLMVNIQPKKIKAIPLYRRLKWLSAAAILIIFLGYLVVQTQLFGDFSINLFAKNEILPAKRTAILKLADGRLVRLKESKSGLVIDAGNMSYADGTAIGEASKLRLDQAMVISTPKGGTYQVLLPDGSKVWLNAMSSITLPAGFASAFNRRVELAGEAYFEIAKSHQNIHGKNRRRPFQVAVQGKTVEVLGTHFNVNSYAEHNGIKTTLLEGRVRVISGKLHQDIVPGQQATTLSHQIKVENADLDEAVAWKNGNFQFSDEKIQNIMHEIGRWYNVNVVYQGAVTRENFGGTISRSRSITEVLSLLEETGAVHFKIEGRSVIVMP